MNPTFIDHVLFAVFAAIFPLWALRFGFRRLRVARREDLPRVRRSVYRMGMLLQWSLTLTLLGHWFGRMRSAEAIGLAPLLTPGLAGVAAGMLIVAWFLVRQRNEAMESDESLGQVRDKMRHLEAMLPRNGAELRDFFRLSLTAGVCEEIMYRGFMIWYLGNWLDIITAAVVASVLFGFGHAYQGWRGVLLTAAVGGFLAAVYLVTGSLFPGMVIHALMDIHSGHLAMVAFRREDALRAEESARVEAEIRALVARQEAERLAALQAAAARAQEEAAAGATRGDAEAPDPRATADEADAAPAPPRAPDETS